MPHEHEDERRAVVDNLIDLLRVEADRLALKQKLKNFHSADIAEALEELSDETKHTIMASLDIEQQVEVLDEASEQEVDEFVEEAPVAELAELVDAMPADEAADILERVDDKKAEAVIAQLEPEHAEEVRELREYDPDTAGGIMTTEFFWIKPELKANEIITRLKEEHEEVETVHEIFVCREDRKLKGIIRVADLIAAEPDTNAEELMDPAMITVGPHADQEICGRYMQKYDLAVLPVIDAGRRLLGIITHDDILEVMNDEASEDMYRMAGVGDPKPLEHGAFVRAYKRLPWLAVTLVGYTCLGLIISRFAATIQQVVAITFFMPAVMALGGNTAMQSSTITVRGLATGEIDWGDLWRMLRRELLVGIIIAVVCSVALGCFAYGVNAVSASTHGAPHVSSARVAMTVSAAMLCGIISSVFLGTLIPMLCNRAGFDPALAAGPFITTLIDIGTQTIYLLLATWLLMANV